jgi:hypothetical protein
VYWSPKGALIVGLLVSLDVNYGAYVIVFYYYYYGYYYYGYYYYYYYYYYGYYYYYYYYCYSSISSAISGSTDPRAYSATLCS